MAQSLSRKNASQCALYLDESDRQVIDFNPAYITEFLRLSAAIFPATPPRVVLVAGRLYMRYIFKGVKALSPGFGLDAFELIAREEVYQLVEDPSDVPAQWLRDGRGRAHSWTDRRNQWCYERCLQDEGKITTKDVFNPGPWPYPEEDAGEIAHDVTPTEAASIVVVGGDTVSSETDGKQEAVAPASAFAIHLKTIEEESGEDEW